MFAFPPEITNYLLGVFGGANQFVSTYLSQVPNAHEPSLDTALVSYIARESRPVQFPNDWVVKLDTHFLGNSRYWGRWEIADIGLLLMFRRRGQVLRTKVALLQSKRLYAREQKSTDEPNYVGFGALHESDKTFLKTLAPRTFTFDDESYYKALNVDDEQYSAINDYETLSQIPICYLFYNPLLMPSTIRLPCATPETDDTDAVVGARVLPYDIFRNDVAPSMTSLTPTYGDVCYPATPPFDQADNRGGWTLEDFVVNRFTGCETGYRVDTSQDTTLTQLFGGRSAPIYAAISINIDVPENAEPVA